MTFTLWALPAIPVALFAWSAAVVVLRAASHRSLNRRLATVLVLEGCWMAGGIFFMVDSPAVFMAIATVTLMGLAALPFQYLAFLGVALDTPLVAPFRSRGAFWTLTACSVAAATAILVAPRAFIGELYSPSWATWNFQFTTWGTGLSLFHGASSLFGLIAALAALARARKGTVARQRAGWFALAFGLRDLFTASTFLLYAVLRPIPLWGDLIYNLAPGIWNVLYVALTAYGVLRVQLFDLDLKLKFALRQSTVGAAIAGAFFLGSELLEGLVPVEGTILGLLSAGVIVALLKPVQAVAERFAGRIMTGVSDHPSYLEGQKHQVYQAALEGALEDGSISDRERSILDRLREQLGIDSEIARTLERDTVRLVTGGGFD